MSIPISKSAPRTRRVLAMAFVVALALALAAALVGLAGCDSSEDETTTETTATGSTASAGVTTTSSPVTETIYPTDEIYPSTTATTIEKVEKLTLVAPPGPMAIPLAYMTLNDKLATVADETEFMIWENGDQLKAIVSGEQGDFVTMPSNNAAIFRNKGIRLQLLNISVWNITYLVSTDPDVSSFSDIKGQSLVVSLQGSVPDVMFQYLCKQEGLDPETDFELRYASDPTQAAQLLLAGEVDNAVLSEALATSVLQKTETAEKPLYRAFAFDAAWIAANSQAEDTPIAGTVVAERLMNRRDLVAVFQREYEAAVQWMLDDPVAAGELVEKELPELGLKASVMTESLKNITWRYTSAYDARWYLDRFYGRLSELSPEVIGGQLPGDEFYFIP